MNDVKRITFDFETRSTCDLKKAGAFKYSLDSTTHPTCMAFKVRNNDTIYFLNSEQINTTWKDLPFALRAMWQRFISEDYLYVAHNAFFETVIYKNILVKRYGWPDIPFRQFRCTAAKAAACALPRSLEGAGTALNLTTQKDKRGYAAMMATCKPTKQWNAWVKAHQEIARGVKVGPKKLALVKSPKPPLFLEYEHNPQTWETLYEYCKIDVATEELLDKTLPDLIPEEQEIWFLNQRLNWHGLKIDIPLVRKIVDIMAKESETKLKELDTLTMGLVTKAGARQSILDFLALEGVKLPDIRAKTVEDAIKSEGLNGDMKRLLEIRQALSKTSTKKYQGFLDRANEDDRCRDILLYSGASTGRDTGTGLQPHNFPRGLIKIDKDRPYVTVENVAKCDVEMLKLLYGESLPLVFSALLRNMIIPSEGCELFVADFSKIEVAVLWWLAGNWKGLKVLKSGKDPYKYQAAENTGKRYEDISDDGEERQLGKAQVLGAGFRMGWKRFKETAFDQYRLKLTNRQSVDAIKSYREANAPVVELWNHYEEAMVQAVEEANYVDRDYISPSSYFAGKCAFTYCNITEFLWVTLPSGRRLAYFQPQTVWRTITFTVLETDAKGREIEVEKTSKPKKTLQILGLDQSKKGMRTEFLHGGIMTENIVQAVARDLMMSAMLRLEKSNYTPLLMVHDEGICEKKKGEGDLHQFIKILCEKPKWADEHLPLDAKGWIGPRYRK